MKIKYIFGVLLISVVLTGAGCIVSNKVESGPIQTLPDHITEIQGTTLPKAILEARERGKSRVVVTDTNSNVISLNISSPTHTIVTMTDPLGIDDPIQFMSDYNIGLEKAYNITREGGEYEFFINTVRHDSLATIVYEISTRIFKISTTQDWVIDLE